MDNHAIENTTQHHLHKKENTLGIKIQFNRKTFIEKYVFVYKHFHFLIMNHVSDKGLELPLKERDSVERQSSYIVVFRSYLHANRSVTACVSR